jgi:hypothetical protein
MAAIIGALIYLGIILLFLVGYVGNIVHIVHHHAVVDFMLILRCVGIAMAPLGAILGYF